MLAGLDVKHGIAQQEGGTAHGLAGHDRLTRARRGAGVGSVLGRALAIGDAAKRQAACVRWMYAEWDALSEWMGFRKVRPGICLWSGMQFPVEGSGGKCDPEFAIGVGWSFPTGP